MPKVLSQEQVQFFRENGYLYGLEGIGPERAAKERASFEAWQKGTSLTSKDIGFKPHLILRQFYDLVTNPRTLDYVEDLIGPDIMVFSSNLFVKQAHDGRFVSWHRDDNHTGIEPHEGVAVQVTLTEGTLANGCLRVISGSHKDPNLGHDETYNPLNMLSRGQVLRGVDESRAVDFVMPAGSLSFHHERLTHSSQPNLSNDARIAYSALYISAASGCSFPDRRGALLVRGRPVSGAWDMDPVPVRDEDPEIIAYVARGMEQYSRRPNDWRETQERKAV